MEKEAKTDRCACPFTNSVQPAGLAEILILSSSIIYYRSKGRERKIWCFVDYNYKDAIFYSGSIISYCYLQKYLKQFVIHYGSISVIKPNLVQIWSF